MTNPFNEENIGEFAARLSERIVSHANNSPNNGPWTAAVFKSLQEVASARGWKIFPEEKPYRGEYLCDFMLFEIEYGCRIACESQWWWDTDPLHGLEWAFDKLRGVKSDLKLFIYEGNDGDLESLVSKYLERNAQIAKGELFLALRWSKDHFENHFWIAPLDGVQPGTIEFTRLQNMAEECPSFVIDKLGNNVAVRCPKCQSIFIISEMLNRKTSRFCPHCGKSTAGFVNGSAFVK